MTVSRPWRGQGRVFRGFNATFREMQCFCRATRRRAGGLVYLEGGRGRDLRVLRIE